MTDLSEKTKELGDKYLSEIVDKYDSEIAKAFVLQAGKVLNDNGIHLYVNYNTLETSVIYNSNNNTIYEQKYELSFGSLDTSEHDEKVRADAIEDFANWLPKHFDLRFYNNPEVWIDEYFNHTREKILKNFKEQIKKNLTCFDCKHHFMSDCYLECNKHNKINDNKICDDFEHLKELKNEC